MAQLFHRSANNIAKISMIMAVVLGGVAFFVYMQLSRSSYVTNQYLEIQQPVQFSHKHHTGDDGIDCRYCHTAVETSYSAGIPPTQTCMNCHSQIWADSPYRERRRLFVLSRRRSEYARRLSGKLSANGMVSIVSPRAGKIHQTAFGNYQYEVGRQHSQ
jgi:hypothetical protein